MNITSIKEIFGIIFAMLATVVSSAFGAHMGMMKILLIFIIADYITGLIVAGVFKKSGKTETGALESRAGLKGLFRKGCMILVVFVSVQLDLLIDTNYIAMAVIYFFIANELISLIENVGLMGVKLPPVINNAIEVLKKQSDVRK